MRDLAIGDVDGIGVLDGHTDIAIMPVAMRASITASGRPVVVASSTVTASMAAGAAS